MSKYTVQVYDPSEKEWKSVVHLETHMAACIIAFTLGEDSPILTVRVVDCNGKVIWGR